jgi:zinc-ribbon domain
MAPEVCPNCGAVVPARAKACPECGSDESTGWSDAAKLDQLGLPREEFDYEAYVAEEFGEGRPKRRPWQWLWWVTALGLIGLFLWYYR